MGQERHPLAYFITFRTHGTWLPGDERGTVDDSHNLVGEAPIPPIPARERAAANRMIGPAVILTHEQRSVITRTIHEVCAHCGWTLFAVAVRTNHVHVVVGAEGPPERVMNRFKSWATRRLVEAALNLKDVRLWARHGSTRYLWERSGIDDAVQYVQNHQDLERQVRVAGIIEARPAGAVEPDARP